MCRLKTWAKPLDDTVDSAISRALDAAEKMQQVSPYAEGELSKKKSGLVKKTVAESSKSFIEHLLAMPDVGDDADFDRNRS